MPDLLRVATLEDSEAIGALMRVSIAGLFPPYYDPHQIEAALAVFGEADRAIIEDGTYYVIEEGGRLVAGGGWSRRERPGEGGRLLDPARQPARVRLMFVHPDRARLGHGTRILEACETAARAEGFRSLALMATLPGRRLYERFGFRVVELGEIPLGDGMTLAGAVMEKPVPA